MAKMLKTRPFSAKEVFFHVKLSYIYYFQKLVQNMEFLAENGPLRMLDHEGKHLNYIQYYLIDVFFFLTFIVVVVLGLIGLCCIASCRLCYKIVRRKYAVLKQE